jgi:hypothetical protein
VHFLRNLDDGLRNGSQWMGSCAKIEISEENKILCDDEELFYISEGFYMYDKEQIEAWSKINTFAPVCVEFVSLKPLLK